MKSLAYYLKALKFRCEAAYRAMAYKFIGKYHRYNGRADLRVLFILTYSFEWDCFKSIYREFASASGVSVKVVADDHKDGRRVTLPSDVLREEGIAAETQLSKLARSYKPHVVFVATDVSLREGAWPLYSRSRIVYIPYGTSISAAAYSKVAQYNTWLHNNAWMICVSHDFVKEMYAQYCERGDAHVLVTGHPKDEVMLEGAGTYHPADVDSRLSYVSNRKKTIFLWNIQFRDKVWSTWRNYGEAILRMFEDKEDAILICRPHPFFFDEFEDPAAPEYIRNKIQRNRNTILDESASMSNAFWRADALLTDGSSLIYHFWWTFKPILYLRTAESESLHEHAMGLVRKYHDIGVSIEDIEGFVDRICDSQRHPSPIRSRLETAKKEMPSPAGAGHRIAQVVEFGIRNHI